MSPLHLVTPLIPSPPIHHHTPPLGTLETEAVIGFHELRGFDEVADERGDLQGTVGQGLLHFFQLANVDGAGFNRGGPSCCCGVTLPDIPF